MLFAFFIRNERGQALDPNGVTIRSEQSGIKNVNSDTGKYYIQIISSQVDWTLRVEDCGSQNDGSHDISTGRNNVVDNTVSNKKLPPTGGPAILAPAIVLLLGGAATGLLAMRRR